QRHVRQRQTHLVDDEAPARRPAAVRRHRGGRGAVKLLTTALSDVGRVRAANEDAFVVDDAARLLAVADGMGGHQAGEVASATAIEALQSGLKGGRPIDEAIVDANTAVVERASGDPELRGMGTTLTAAVFDDDQALVIGHVGDSRAYLLR